MFKETPTPQLIQLYFGEHAESAWLIATDRLKKWCTAFEDWLAMYQPHSQKSIVTAWQRLINNRHQMPWTMTRIDIEQHVAWMGSNRYTSNTINTALANISSFYKWCAKQQVDPECGQGFNPVADISRPKNIPGGKLLSREEVEALLGVLQLDETPLGKREYAFTLARLRMGVPHERLQRLQWKMILQGEGKVQLRGKTGALVVPLPGEVWEAFQSYLSASGRLESMHEDEFIFVPLAKLGPNAPLDRKETWACKKYLTTEQLRRNLKVYGRAAFIDEDKLNLPCLLNTALRLKLNEGASLEEMKVFLGSKLKEANLKQRLKHVPELPKDTGILTGRIMTPPNRIGPQPGAPIKHGHYSQKLPEEDVQAVLDENVEGLEEELVCMRRLARGLISAQKMTADPQELAAVLDGYSLAATRIAGLIDAERELAETPSEPPWLEGHLKMLDGVRARTGKEPLSGLLREMFQGAGYEPSETDRKLEEEIAALRFILRNIYLQANQTLEEGHIRHYANLVTMYGRSCSRLISLLKKRVSRGSALADYVWQTWEESKTLWLEKHGWGGDDPINNPQPPVDYVDGEIKE